MRTSRNQISSCSVSDFLGLVLVLIEICSLWNTSVYYDLSHFFISHVFCGCMWWDAVNSRDTSRWKKVEPYISFSILLAFVFRSLFETILNKSKKKYLYVLIKRFIIMCSCMFFLSDNSPFYSFPLCSDLIQKLKVESQKYRTGFIEARGLYNGVRQNVCKQIRYRFTLLRVKPNYDE